MVRHGVAVQAPPVEVWPPDDTEESVVGTNLQQEAITNLRTGLNEVASALALAGGPRPWHAYTQTGIGGLRRRDGSPYTVLPDVFVYDHAIDERQATLVLAVEGPPRLVVEVLSQTTHERDLDMDEGKGYSYADAGIPEYLILDPGGQWLAGQGQGWRLERGVYVPWQAEADGRWHSQELGVAIAFEGVRAVVYDREGRRQWREGEVARELARRERERQTELARREQAYAEELARREQEIAALRQRLAELGETE